MGSSIFDHKTPYDYQRTGRNLRITHELIGKFIRRTAPHNRTGDRSYIDETFFVISVGGGGFYMRSVASGWQKDRCVHFCWTDGWDDGEWELVDTYTQNKVIDDAIKTLQAAGISPEIYAELLKKK